MTLGTRLWLLGAALPTGLLLVGLLAAGQVFRAGLLSSLDQGLLAQAAAESVSLFDRPDGPHLHMAESPLLEAVRPFAPTGELFDASGRLVAHFPPLPHPADATAPAAVGPTSELASRGSSAGPTRELVVRVASPAGDRYVLRLTASMVQLETSVRRFHEVALTMVALTAIALVVLQLFFARRLAARLKGLKEHLARLERGQLDVAPPSDDGGDEVAELRAVLAGTTVTLKAAREAQDLLLAEAAHELRTPLTLMRTSLDLALRRERSVDELHEALRETRTEVDRLARLATHLLELGAAERSWDLAVGDVMTVLDEAAEAARAEAEQRGLWLEVVGQRPCVQRFSQVALRQALDNLVANALRFAPRGTSIRLELTLEPHTWRVSVCDEGPGIPEAQREAVFAPFHRGDMSGGSGLGLAIVAEVARLHGGRAWAAEHRPHGTCVIVELPLLR